MCGIAGVVNSKSVTKAEVATMIEKIGYRGVDEKGVHQVGPAVLGHARLAVVDPLNGMQPMSNEDQSVWVVFNGEIYNFIELREELKQKGHIFKSRCDTEVLVHLWEEMGEKMLSRLIGMYAFFIWDEKKKKGILARDRQGIKPCYFSKYDGGIAFCSEIKGLLTLPKMSKIMNKDTLLQVFAMNYPPPPETCFEGVQHLMPGHYMVFEGNQNPTTHQYWQWPLNDTKKIISHDEFSALLSDSLRLQLRFDVPGGLFLSGGVDSSVVAQHLAKSWTVKNFDSLGLDFNQDGFSEFQQAQVVAKMVGSNISPLQISPQDIPEIAGKVGYHADQPHGDFSFYLFYLLSKKAHSMKKIVMFNGDGPDEALLGFTHNQTYLSRLNFSMKTYYDLINYMNADSQKQYLSTEFLAGTTDPYEKFMGFIKPWAHLDPIEQVSAYELTSLMPGNNLIKGDRMGAAWSIEGRGPLLDHRISEAFTRLPTSEKLKNGVGKFFFKDYALRFFPREMIFKDKKMPTMPIGEWIKSDLYGWAKSIFSQSPDDGIFNQKAILQMLDDHRDNKRNHTQQIRTILMTKIWFKNFFSN